MILEDLSPPFIITLVGYLLLSVFNYRFLLILIISR